MPKIIQIACGNTSNDDHVLYALDDDGKIYVRQYSHKDNRYEWNLEDDGELPEEKRDEG